jgi:hypothetical protein
VKSWRKSLDGDPKLKIKNCLSSSLWVASRLTTHSDLDGDVQMGMFGSDVNFDVEVGQVPTLVDPPVSPSHGATFCTLQKTTQSLKRKNSMTNSLANKGWHTSSV